MSKPKAEVKVEATSAVAVDWTRPWLAPIRQMGVQWATHHQQHTTVYADALNQGMAATTHAPVRFVPQSALPDDEAYEAFIARTRQVPTRDNLHDLFNGLIWQRWPRTKARLNALQAAEIARDGIAARRGPVRDAITVFDENGALLLAPPALWQALLHRDWMSLFVTHRALWQEARLVLFGHALMEQLVRPRKNLTTHVLVWPDVGVGLASAALDAGDADAWRHWDAQLAQQLSPDWLARKPLTPLPVLGHPGWWPDNERADFYADAHVFRPLRPLR